MKKGNNGAALTNKIRCIYLGTDTHGKSIANCRKGGGGSPTTKKVDAPSKNSQSYELAKSLEMFSGSSSCNQTYAFTSDTL